MKARCEAQSVVTRIVERGGRITVGTDSPIVPYGLSLHLELALLVRAGLEPAEALRAATLWPAEALGVAVDLGTIEAGKLADMIIVDGDPLANIEDAMNIVVTIKGGQPHPIASLLAAP